MEKCGCGYDLYRNSTVTINVLKSGAAGELCYLIMKAGLSRLEKTLNNGRQSRPVKVVLSSLMNERTSVFYICLKSKAEIEQLTCMDCKCEDISIKWRDEADNLPLVVVVCCSTDFPNFANRLDGLVSENRSVKDDLYSVALIDSSGDHVRVRCVRKDIFDSKAEEIFVGCRIRRDEQPKTAKE